VTEGAAVELGQATGTSVFLTFGRQHRTAGRGRLPVSASGRSGAGQSVSDLGTAV